MVETLLGENIPCKCGVSLLPSPDSQKETFPFIAGGWFDSPKFCCRRIYRREFEVLNKKIDNGTARPCFALDILEGAAKKEFSIDEEEKLMTFGTLLEAGGDTSRTAVTQLVAAAAIYPEWVKTARSHLDKVCGANAERLPSLSDREKLPYIMAVVKEALRWRPFIQTGVPHMLEKDDEYMGYKFPAGTQFTWNAYAIALNDEEYPNAKVFKPERFLNEDLNSPLKGHWAFGAGMYTMPLSILLFLNLGSILTKTYSPRSPRMRRV